VSWSTASEAAHGAAASSWSTTARADTCGTREQHGGKR